MNRKFPHIVALMLMGICDVQAACVGKSYTTPLD
jgi:hypothetical protein